MSAIRFCELCDRLVRGRECPACGADTARVASAVLSALQRDGYAIPPPAFAVRKQLRGRDAEGGPMTPKNPAAVAMGSVKSPRKAAAARVNGQSGGRPRKDGKPPKPKEKALRYEPVGQ